MIDLTFLKKFTKDDPQKMKRYISLYLNEAPKTFEEMKKNFDDKDWEQMRINAHSLKPQADFMGILTLKNELIEIEEAVKENKISTINEHFDLAKDIYINSVISLKKILENL